MEIENSLRRLQTDHVDLYQLHLYDPETPMSETLMALGDLVKQGKVRYIGCSGIAAWQVCDAVWTARRLRAHSFVSVQGYYNLLSREAERDLIPFCRSYGLGFIPYFPLESGLLTERYSAGQPIAADSSLAKFQSDAMRASVLTPRNIGMLEKFQKFCREREHNVRELALAWLLAKREVSTVITGVTKAWHVRSNVRALDLQLSPADLATIDDMTADNPWLTQPR